MSEDLIAAALHAYLATISQKGGSNLHFFQLKGFDELTYKSFLARLRADEDHLASKPVTICTTAPISNYEQYAIEEKDKSAAWYRNHVQRNHVLILILNSNTSEAQSLQDIHLVNQTILATKGLQYLFNAIFKDYRPNPEDVIVLEKFLSHFRRAVFEPQLSSLVEFLKAIDELLAKRQANTIQLAIALSLPYLELFRYQKLAQEPQMLSTARVEPVLREIHRAARLGTAGLDNRERNMYLDRLEKAEFDDESAYGKLSSSQKKDLLRRFLSETVAFRSERIKIFELDWQEVKSILSNKTHPRRADQLKTLAKNIEDAFRQQEFALVELPEYIHDVLRDMQNGKDANNEQMNRLVGEYQDLLGKQLANGLRRLVKADIRNYSDFLVAVTTLAMELLNPLQVESREETSLYVTFLPGYLKEIGEKEREALAAFKALYGGLEQIIPSVHCEFTELWKMAEPESDSRYLFDVPDVRENEKEFKVLLRFRVAVRNDKGQEINQQVDFNWQYHSDSPAAATLASLQAEKNRFMKPEALPSLFPSEEPAPSIPIYNTCTITEDIRDLDLYRPRYSLGSWYEKPSDLRPLLMDQLKGRATGETLSKIEQALGQLEQAWQNFLQTTNTKGILGSDLDKVLEAYDQLLLISATYWSGSDVASRGYRVLTQAWMISPKHQPSRNPWAIVPFLHPLKLLWWRERARRFNSLIADLLDSSTQTSIADEALFRRELPSLYGSSGFPAIIAQPIREGWPEFFLPVDEVDGYELYRLSTSASETYGADVERMEELDSEEAETKRAAEAIANVIQDYIETYPFVRDGAEIVLLQCRDAALPELLVEHLVRLAELRNWSIALSVIVHTEDRGAPLFRRVSNWLSADEKWNEHKERAYFPPISMKVLECDYEELFRYVENNKRMDIVVLTDLLEEKGQKIERDWSDEVPDDTSLIGYLPTYHAQQEPFERAESNRTIVLNQPPYPSLVRHFYNMQYAAQRRTSIKSEKLALFRKMFGLQDWETVLTKLHTDFNWVVCYDTTIDRYLLENTFPQSVQVIRYSLGLGIKRQHNLTVSSSHQAQDVVVRRLTMRLSDILTNSPDTYSFRLKVAQRLVDEAKQVSGDIVLRAAGPGSYLNELIGLVVAKHLTEQRYLADHIGALTTWIYLDDFGHWFRGKYPDLLFIAIPPEGLEKFVLRLEVVETKCVGQESFDVEAKDAQRQTVLGVNRLAQAWVPGARHLDADYWYDQLYRAVVGNISVEPGQRMQWEAFRDHLLPNGDFELDLSGHSWIFCHDSSAVVSFGQFHDEGNVNVRALDAQKSPLTFHHYGRAGLRRALLDLVQQKWRIDTPLHMEQEEGSKKTGVSPQAEPSTNESDISDANAAAEQNKFAEAIEDAASNTTNIIDPTWLQSKASDLERALRQYNIRAYPIDASLADIGPSVIRFKVRLYPGEQLVKVQRMATDLARELALTEIPFIDNVLGTNFVGIDLPRPNPQIVYLLPLLKHLRPSQLGELQIILGQTPDGRIIVEDLADFPHLLVAGATNSGKSVFLRSLVLCLLSQYKPKDLQLLIVDPKQIDFSFFDGLPHLMNKKIITDRGEARDALLDLIHDEMVRRQQIMARRSWRVKDFNQRFPNEALNPIVAIIDEYAQLISVMSRQEREAFERDLMNLAGVARATGIHLVLATQRPSADIVTGTLKANLETRIAFKVASRNDSDVILGQGGAENLLGYGDMLFRQSSGKLLRLQASFIDEISVEDYLNSVK